MEPEWDSLDDILVSGCQRLQIEEAESLPLGNLPDDVLHDVCLREVVEHIASFLPRNDLACLRFVSKPWREYFTDRTVLHLSELVPREEFRKKWQPPGSCRELTRDERDKLVSLAAATDCVDNLKVALAATGLPPGPHLFKDAAAGGAIATCTYLQEDLNLRPFDMEEFAHAGAKNGHGAVIDWGIGCFPQREERLAWAAARGAAEGGHLELSLKYMFRALEISYDSGCSSGSDVAQQLQQLNTSALAGFPQPYCKVLQEFLGRHGWRWGRGFERWGTSHMCKAMSAALFSDTADWEAKAVDVLTAGRGQGGAEGDVDFSECYGSDEAARMTGPAVLTRFEWLKAQRYPPSKAKNPSSLLHAAVTGRNTAAVQWLLAQGLAAAVGQHARGGLVVSAAAAGHVGALKAMKQAGWALNPARILVKGAAGGHVSVLSWAWESFGWSNDSHGLTVNTFAAACSSGSVAAMRWVHERLGQHGGMEGAWKAVVWSGCEAAAELLAELGCAQPLDGLPYAHIFIDSLRNFKYCSWWMFHCLHRLGVAFGPVRNKLVAKAVEAGVPLGTLRWLLEQGCTVRDWDVVRAALEGRRVCGPGWCEAEADVLEVVEWVAISSLGFILGASLGRLDPRP
ncbi:hypothetical protein HYH03_003263 [Edaphochlamys debaryana]|uniref:F-box domain-containing protein n=1 Tax=Edaphochlamys debaryana TaxID=47281 RepID=A0A835Y9Z0_9CHLO|nr:hypothetical protein HYH03_003263 [Edaphochlamys debaryana]|eukprot:KAG2499080.1 hypothetical protein HYH03_003263 [Edaphochlamys debaryana]